MTLSADDGRGRSIFVTGLRNAHALENQALSLMDRQIERIENYPAVLERMKQHRSETENQIERLETILKSMDEDYSSIKDAGASLMGNLAAMGHTLSSDEILKNSFANFAFENYELATYKSLCQMAELTGNSQALQPLQQSMKEEQAMVQWLDHHLPEATSMYMRREIAGQDANV